MIKSHLLDGLVGKKNEDFKQYKWLLIIIQEKDLITFSYEIIQMY